MTSLLYPEQPIIDEPRKEKDPYAPSSAEIDSFLKKKGLKPTKANAKRARRKLRRRAIKEAIARGADISFSQSEANWQVVYGEMIVPAVLPFLHETNANNWLHHIYVVAAHEIEEITSLYINDTLIEFNGGTNPDVRWASGPNVAPSSYDAKVFKAAFLGTTSQTVQSDANTQLPTLWTSNHRLRNHAGAYIILVLDGVLYSEGHPDINFKIKGKKVWDPRTGTTVYSNNAALCIADYLLDSKIGLGYSTSDIDTASLEAAADLCDENVALKAGGTEKRYTCNGYFDLGSDPEQILNELTTSYGGSVCYSAGKWRFLPAEYRTPAITLTDDDLVSSPSLQTVSGRGDKFNGVRVQYVASEDSYKVKEAPAYVNSTYQTQDGGEAIIEDMTLPFTTSASMAQRLARIEIERSRRDVVLSASWKLKAFQLNVGDTVQITLSRYGFSAKTFEVLEWGFSFNEGLEPFVDLVLQEIDSNAFAWNETVDEASIAQPAATNLPSPNSSPTPSSVTAESGTEHLYIRSDGTIQTRVKVSWPVPTNLYVVTGGRTEIQYRKTTDGAWQDGPNAFNDQSHIYILDAQDSVEYYIRVRHVTAIGVVSEWTTITHTVVGKTEPPTTPTGYALDLQADGVYLSWDPITDPDLVYYEIRLGGTSDPIEATEVIGLVNDNYFLHRSYLQGNYKFWMRSVDTTGNYSTAQGLTTSVIAPGAVQNFTIDVIDNFAQLDWTDPITGSYPISHYNVYKGPSATASYFRGTVDGTFFQYFTTSGENSTFWVEAVDVGGNKGAATSQSVALYPPDNYVLKASGSPTVASETLSNAVDDTKRSGTGGSAFLAPVDTTETWEEHFINNNYASLPLLLNNSVKLSFQDFIDDERYTIYAQPSSASDGYLEWSVDLGVVVPGSRIALEYITEQLGTSTATVTPSISYKENSGDSYTEVSGNREIYASSFRYLKFRITISSNNDDRAIARVSAITYRVNVKQISESGTETSSNSGATTVTFTKSFLDISDIQITAEGTSAAYTCAWDFADGPNPTTMDVYVRDKDGNLVAVDFKWRVEGTIAPGAE